MESEIVKRHLAFRTKNAMESMQLGVRRILKSFPRY